MRTTSSPPPALPTKQRWVHKYHSPKKQIVEPTSPSMSSSILNIPYALDGIKCREQPNESLQPILPSGDYQLHGVSAKPIPSSYDTTSVDSRPISRFQMYYSLHKRTLQEYQSHGDEYNEYIRSPSRTTSPTPLKTSNPASIAYILS